MENGSHSRFRSFCAEQKHLCSHLCICPCATWNPQQPFKSLKSLTLHLIYSVDVKIILSSCPKHESLCLDACSLPSKVFIGGGKQLELKSLTFIACYGAKEDIYIFVC
ncbi:unnamed protein product [Cuscuta epithymum]|uniref:Uncharacterized protein n=1 Tax=Cuscuta epithymum TaxID=186058 RepID=A0AAV0FLZ1_9ASTE|nr:unnamed protein product [Cuscuta epithymum]